MPIEDLAPEVQSIITDPNNVDHQKYWRGDEATVAKVNAAYKLKYGETSKEPTPTGETPLDPEMQALKEKYESGSGNDQPLDAAAENYRVEQELRTQWGPDYEMNRDLCWNVITDTFDGGDLFNEDLFTRIAKAIGDDTVAMNLLLKIAKRGS